MQKIVGDLELVKGHIRNLRPEKLPTDPNPTDLESALVWYNTTENVLKYWDGTNVIVLASSDQLIELISNSVKVYEYVAIDASTDHTVTHNFGRRWVQVTVYNELGEEIAGDVTAVDTNILTVKFLLPIKCTVVVHGRG